MTLTSTSTSTSTSTWIVAVMVVLLVASPAAAHGEGSTRYRLALLSLGTNFPGEAWPEVEQRVAAELEVMGFDVVAFDATAPEVQGRMRELAEIAVTFDAFAGACISFDGGEGTIRVWLQDAGPDRRVERSFSGDRVHDADAVARIGLSAAELLQAVLLEDLLARSTPVAGGQGAAAPLPTATAPVQPAPATPWPTDAADPPTVYDRPQETEVGLGPTRGELTRGRIWGALGASIPFDPLYGQALVTIGGGVRLRDWLSLDAEASVTASPNALDITMDLDFTTPGSMVQSFIYDATLRVQLAFHPWPRSRTIRPAFGLGAGMFIAWHRGVYYPADGGEQSFYGSSVAGVAAASARFDIPVSSRALVFLGATVGIAFPYTTIIYFQHAISTVGIPLLETVVGVEWSVGRPLARNR